MDVSGNVVVAGVTSPVSHASGTVVAKYDRSGVLQWSRAPGDSFNNRPSGVAVLGSDALDVPDIDVSSLELEGAEPLRHSYKDIAARPGEDDGCPCSNMGPDGFTDLLLDFNRLDVMSGLGGVSGGDVPLTISGTTNDGTSILRIDRVRIVPGSPDALRSCS